MSANRELLPRRTQVPLVSTLHAGFILQVPADWQNPRAPSHILAQEDQAPNIVRAKAHGILENTTDAEASSTAPEEEQEEREEQQPQQRILLRISNQRCFRAPLLNESRIGGLCIMTLVAVR
jgi:hypothetical protein